MRSTTTRLSLLTLVLGFSACVSEPDDICVAERKLAANKLATNRIALNRIALNRISLNGLLGRTLPEVALTSDSLAASLAPDALADEDTASLLEYTVSCALAPDQAVDVVVDGDIRTFPGSLGLAPAWGTPEGACDGTCMGWVSACLLARTNFKGESVPISLLGGHPGLEPTADESIAFPVEEATYFGDLFASPVTMYACLPAGETAAVRTCGSDTAGCPIDVVGACDDVCDAAGCRNADGQIFAETITVHIRDAASSCE
jgi:hypothetical protein